MEFEESKTRSEEGILRSLSQDLCSETRGEKFFFRVRVRVRTATGLGQHCEAGHRPRARSQTMFATNDAENARAQVFVNLALY